MAEPAKAVPLALPPSLAADAVADFEADATDLAPWEQRLDLGEGTQAYHAFTHYRDLDPRDRNMRRAYTMHMVDCVGRQLQAPEGQSAAPLMPSSGTWREWKDRFRWDERVALHEAYQDRLEREANFRAVKDMNNRHAQLAKVFLNKVMQRITAFDLKEVDGKTLVAWLDKASMIERRARGEATEIVQNETSVNVSVPHANELRARLRKLGILQEIAQTVEDIEFTVSPVIKQSVIDVTPEKAASDEQQQ